jgi:protein-L-isoaspartate(D-aspartate) O-methyltransferase
VPRENFVAEADRPFAYADRELLMSTAAPARRMMIPVLLARLAQALALDPDGRAMALGCGSGWSAAVLSHLAGSVVAVEEDPALLAMAREALPAAGAANVTIVEGKLTEGCAREAPFDAILVDGAVEIVTDALVAQLKPGGLLAAVVRSERISRAMLYERVGGETTKWPQFEAWAPPLPGFERKPEFVF